MGSLELRDRIGGLVADWLRKADGAGMLPYYPDLPAQEMLISAIEKLVEENCKPEQPTVQEKRGPGRPPKCR